MRPDNLQNLLTDAFAAAVGQITGRALAQVDPQVRPAGDPKFGDYQCNVAMSLAKPLQAKPRDVAVRIKEMVEPRLADVVEPLEIAGPGFINIRLRDRFLAERLAEIRPAPTAGPDRIGLTPVEHLQRVVVEYSQPNIAEQMHVGHLRGTIIGDVFARVLAFEGHEVIRQNHIGDWGTQMGAVILGLWHIRRMLRRKKDISLIRSQLEELKTLGGAEPGRIKDVLSRICHDWHTDVADPDLDQSLGEKVSLDELELGYTFAQALAAAAAVVKFEVPYKDRKLELLSDLPRKVTQMLQEGGDKNKPEQRAWTLARKISLNYCEDVYRKLGVLLQRRDVRGESYYRKRLSDLVAELRRGLPPREPTDMVGRAWAEVREDQGAVCVFLWDEKGQPRFKTPEGSPLPLIIQKTPEKSLADDEGAFLYATTDLAAIRFRLKDLPFSCDKGAQRVIYVTDARQKLHFEMFLAVARAAGWIGEDVRVEHVTFGSVLGPDRKPLKTREGGTTKLRELLEEAEKRAYQLLESRDQGIEGARDQGENVRAPELTKDEKREIARRVGIAAVKYADLSRDRTGDYVFNWDTMLALQGNTAPYMMYAYARIRSIYRKAAERIGSPDAYAPGVELTIAHPTERALALRLARLGEAIDQVAADLTPHTLCTYLYDLATDFMRFYESCPVIAAAEPGIRLSRLRLCDLTARTLRLGLGLLGIEVLERM